MTDVVSVGPLIKYSPASAVGRILKPGLFVPASVNGRAIRYFSKCDLYAAIVLALAGVSFSSTDVRSSHKLDFTRSAG